MSIKLQELELTRPLSPISKLSDNYSACWLLLRFHGEPLAWLTYSAFELPISTQKLIADISQHYSAVLLASAFKQRLAVENGLDGFNLTSFSSTFTPHPAQKPPTISPAFFSVIIRHAHNGNLAACLQALAAQSYRHFELLLIAEQAEGANSLVQELTKQYGAQLVPADNATPQTVLNRAVLASRYPLLAFTTTAAVADSGWLESLAAVFGSSNAVAVCGAHLPLELETPGQLVAYRHAHHPTHFTRLFFSGEPFDYTPEQFGTWHNVAFRKSFWLAHANKIDTAAASLLPIFYAALGNRKTIVYEPRAFVRERFERDTQKALELTQAELAVQREFMQAAARQYPQASRFIRRWLNENKTRALAGTNIRRYHNEVKDLLQLFKNW